LTRLLLSQKRSSEAKVAADEALKLLRECDQQNRLVRSDLACALAAKAAIILTDEGNTEIARESLDEAKTLTRSLLESLHPGRTDVIVHETEAWIDELLKRVDEPN
jgi:energy-coupling factor transporter ATP-binding protein EcfA2